MVRSILFLTVKMARGFGVSVAVEEVARRLKKLGMNVIIGCANQEGEFPDLDIRIISSDPEKIKEVMRGEGIDTVVAHTSPYFEVLPALMSFAHCIAWEYGDPTPEFFSEDGEARRKIVENKKRCVYPVVSSVFTISEFLRAEIEFPSAKVITLGADHVPDLGVKGIADGFAPGERPLRVGTLMRMGKGESRYKGDLVYVDLKHECERLGLRIDFEIMGRGTEADTAKFRDQGIVTHLNASDEERARYLRGLDVFLSLSQWEGFNLPLVEAQALGTPSIAFDVGAHPEVTPLLASSVGEIVALFQAYIGTPYLLLEHGAMAYRFVRQKFRWDAAAALAAQEISRFGQAEVGSSYPAKASEGGLDKITIN